SAANVTTGPDGIASVELRSGAAPAFFRLRIEAFNAAALVVDVTVSDSGFARLDVDVQAIDLGDISSASVRLYRDMDCALLSPTAPPEPVRPPVVLNSVSASPDTSFVIALGGAYSILATANLGNVQVAHSCAKVTADQFKDRDQLLLVLPLTFVRYEV